MAKKVHATIIRGNEAKIKADLKKKLSKIGRYHIGVNRKNGYGHVVIAERINGDSLIFYDPQECRYMRFSAIVANCEYIDLLKVDNLIIDYDTLKEVSRPLFNTR